MPSTVPMDYQNQFFEGFNDYARGYVRSHKDLVNKVVSAGSSVIPGGFGEAVLGGGNVGGLAQGGSLVGEGVIDVGDYDIKDKVKEIGGRVLGGGGKGIDFVGGGFQAIDKAGNQLLEYTAQKAEAFEAGAVKIYGAVEDVVRHPFRSVVAGIGHVGNEVAIVGESVRSVAVGVKNIGVDVVNAGIRLGLSSPLRRVATYSILGFFLGAPLVKTIHENKLGNDFFSQISPSYLVELKQELKARPFPPGNDTPIFIIGDDFSGTPPFFKTCLNGLFDISDSSRGEHDSSKKRVVLSDPTAVSSLDIYRFAFHEQSHDYFGRNPALASNIAGRFYEDALEVRNLMNRCINRKEAEPYKSFFPDHFLELIDDPNAKQIFERDVEEISVRIMTYWATYPLQHTSRYALIHHPEFCHGYSLLCEKYGSVFDNIVVPDTSHVDFRFMSDYGVDGFLDLWGANQKSFFSSFLPLAKSLINSDDSLSFNSWVEDHL